MTGSLLAQEARSAALTTVPKTAVAPLLTVSNLSVSFGQLPALRGVDLAVRPGELVALAGENGAGKTTLVRCIAGDVAPARKPKATANDMNVTITARTMNEERRRVAMAGFRRCARGRIVAIPLGWVPAAVAPAIRGMRRYRCSYLCSLVKFGV